MPTLAEMVALTQDYKPVLFSNAENVSVVQINRSVFIGMKSVVFSGTTKDSESPDGRTIQMMFVLKNMVEPYLPSITKDRVLVRSSSPFYRYAFQYNNKRVGAHLGALSPFTVLGTGRPINPLNYPGLDKHLLGLVRNLRITRMIGE